MALNSPDLKSVNHSVCSIMQEKVYHTHIANGRVETLAGSGVGRAGPQTYRCGYRTVATPSQLLLCM